MPRMTVRNRLKEAGVKAYTSRGRQFGSLFLHTEAEAALRAPCRQ